MASQIVVDRMKCENNGCCMAAAPTLLRPASDGSPLLLSIMLAPEQEHMAHVAVAACPMGALRIEPAPAAE